MNTRIRLGMLSEIPPGEGRVFAAGTRQVAVFHTRAGAVHATQTHCPHRNGPLADGLLGHNTLVCPFHEWSFDLSTGKPINGTCSIEVYPVTKEADGALLVELPGG